jgi:hypothetical protein
MSWCSINICGKHIWIGYWGNKVESTVLELLYEIFGDNSDKAENA